jgi:hypothetical protein
MANKVLSFLRNLLPVSWFPAKSSTAPKNRERQQFALFTRWKLGTMWNV